MTRLLIAAFGRPAPQGSHESGGAGQVLDASPYLPAWRVAVRIACFRAFADAGIPAARLPLFPAGVPVTIEQCTFYVRSDQCRAQGTDEPIGEPDIDKLLRATLDAMGGAKGKNGRVYADDAQVWRIRDLSKERARADRSGALIIVSDGRD